MKTISKIALCAAFALSFSGANASGVTTDTHLSEADNLRVGKTATVAPIVRGLGTSTQFDTAQVAVGIAVAFGGGAGDFTDGTVGTVKTLFAAGSGDTITTQDAALRAMAFNMLNTGIAAVNVNMAASGATELTVTWSQIVEAISTITSTV